MSKKFISKENNNLIVYGVDGAFTFPLKSVRKLTLEYDSSVYIQVTLINTSSVTIAVSNDFNLLLIDDF